jgi:hypothetical protein
MRDIIEDDELGFLFFDLLEGQNPRDRCYIYRMRNGKPVRPALFKCVPFPRLIDLLYNKYAGGDFQIMIRRGTTMLMTGLLRVAEP